MPRHCVCRRTFRAVHPRQGESESILRPQTTGDYTVKAHPHQPKATATNAASTSKILSGRGVQTRTTDVYQWHTITSLVTTHWDSQGGQSHHIRNTWAHGKVWTGRSPLRLGSPPRTDQGRNWSGHNLLSTNRNHKKVWPVDKNDSPLNIREYWPYRDELATENGLAYRGTCLIIPTKLRPEMVVRAHRSHLGIQYTVNTALEIMFWPRMHAEITEAVRRCETCQPAQPQQQRQPLMSYPIPTHQWQLVASDCFEINGRHYVVLVDIYSDFIELSQLPDLSSNALIKAIKPVFAKHGAPATLITDNGTNFISSEFRRFLKSWDINHITSSPHHYKSNGRAEAAVKLMKGIIKKKTTKEGTDMWKAILEWRNATTPGMRSSPAQQLLSRRTRSMLPCKATDYTPQVQMDVQQALIKKKTDNPKLLWPACRTITRPRHRTTYQGEVSSTKS